MFEYSHHRCHVRRKGKDGLDHHFPAQILTELMLHPIASVLLVMYNRGGGVAQHAALKLLHAPQTPALNAVPD
jgi:hypothetical protein